MKTSARLLLSAALVSMAGVATISVSYAQNAASSAPVVAAKADAVAASPAATGLDEIVVTGTIRPEKKINTSISISSISAKSIQQLNPQSAADLIRNLPGIRSEASGGEGNANISVRGLPVASGGAKFVQFQEDGIPVLTFGDVAFATADQFLRSDNNVKTVELVRGGSASTVTSNAPGAIINFISKTGEKEGGEVGITRGLDFDRTRIDFDYGAHAGADWRFHVGGFYRNGKGVKDGGFTAENGGQIKANVTRVFENGFIRLDVKFLDDKTPAYLPVPAQITQTGKDAKYSSLPGFDLISGTLQTPNLQSILSLDSNGNRITDSIADGYRSVSKAFGGEASFDVGDGFKVDNKFRYAINSGKFVGAFAANVNTPAALAAGIGGAGASVTYATGPNAGNAYTGPYAVNSVIFDTTLNNFNTYTNQLNLSKDIDGGSGGKGSITFGYMKSGQHVGMNWHWTNYLLGAEGKNAPLLNVTSAPTTTTTAGVTTTVPGVLRTENGLIAYDARAFGDCCVRSYDVEYSIDAPSLNLNWKVAGFNLDASVRYDIQSARGVYRESSGAGSPIDVNGNGSISAPELLVKTVTSGAPQPVNYTKKYWSYSFGANYELSPDLAFFGRVSRGARFNADRVIPGDANGNVTTAAAVNVANQQEVGSKFRFGPLSGAVTLFHTTTSEDGTDITASGITKLSRKYRAYGAELEGSVQVGLINVYAAATYTDAKITADNFAGATDVGNVPQRQAKFVYQLRPTATIGPVDIGASLVGTTSSYTDSGNGLKQPGYAIIGAFGEFSLTEKVRFNLHADNLFNSKGITEVGQGPTPAGGLSVGTARSVLGRQISIGAKFVF